jgi:Flp pilus assembly pilin Flp
MNKQTHESGQATTEYALVLLAAAVIALLVIAWATNGEGASRIGDMFNQVFDHGSRTIIWLNHLALKAVKLLLNLRWYCRLSFLLLLRFSWLLELSLTNLRCGTARTQVHTQHQSSQKMRRQFNGQLRPKQESPQ